MTQAPVPQAQGDPSSICTQTQFVLSAGEHRFCEFGAKQVPHSPHLPVVIDLLYMYHG
jgi:hypothetical protein